MKKAILATKVGMTQIFNEDGSLIPVTVLQAGPCVVTQIKTVENDGYSAVQVGFVDKKDKIVNKDKAGKKEVIHRNGATKAEKGHFEKAGVSSKRFVENSSLKTQMSMHLHRKSKLISLLKVIRSMLLQLQRVKDSRAQSRDMVSTEDLWHMVLNSIVIRVPTVHVLLLQKYLKEKECLDIWVA